MDSSTVRRIVNDQIAGRWDETNLHGVDLRAACVDPVRMPMILRTVHNGERQDSVVNLWVVLRETPEGDGYIVFYDEERKEFGLASKGFVDDPHPVICGYYGDFWTTFQSM